MADTYCNYEHLASAERKGRDYLIRCMDRGSQILVFGCHGGDIEPGISELVTAIADPDCSYYLFEGIKTSGNRNLHITSTKFDEPEALNLLRSCYKAIAIHGEQSDSKKVYLGGLDADLSQHIIQSLVAAGFATAKHTSARLQGISPENICNKCGAGAGLQLELPRGLRRQFFFSLKAEGRRHPTERFHSFVQAIKAGMRSWNIAWGCEKRRNC